MREKELENKNSERGITLVALVVTIIVLMILAGITISLVLGQNGIIAKAQQSKYLSTNADKATAEGLNNLDNEMTSAIGEKTASTTTVATATGKDVLSNTDNISLKDDNGNIVTIPAGFKIASDSPTKQEDGIIIEDKDGNQFVWIPVVNILNYTRTDFGKEDGNYSNYSETMPTDEQTSVNKYHGYYIGRYEAGDKESTNNKVMRSSSIITDTLTIKKGQAPYNFVTKDQANTLAIGMKTAQNYKATTKLCSSYAWDTAINFIQNKVPNYATSSPQGNYGDTTFSYIDITGATQTKPSSSNSLIPTGQTTSVCNIYDMGGNAWEWTTEACNVASCPCVFHGGYGHTYSTSYPAGARSYNNLSYSSNYVVFRITLYM